METGQQKSSMKDAFQMNPTVLAYLGDAVYEVYVRQHVMQTGQIHADCLHHSAVKYVCAQGQAKAIKKIFDRLPEEQQLLVKRARNKKFTSKSKNADAVTYKWATAFEALVGYLYLTKKEKELTNLFEETMNIIEGGEPSGQLAPESDLREDAAGGAVEAENDGRMAKED